MQKLFYCFWIMFCWVFLAMPIYAELPQGYAPYLSATPQERTICLRLPIAKSSLYWQFKDPRLLLDGKLTMVLDNGKTKKTVVIFSNHRFSQGWYQLINNQNVIVDTFCSTTEYTTSSKDKVSLEWEVKHYLYGQSEAVTGIVIPGKYVATGEFSRFQRQPLHADFIMRWLFSKVSGLFRLGQRQEIAYLTVWNATWPVIVIKNEGFMPKPLAAEMQKADEAMKNKFKNSYKE